MSDQKMLFTPGPVMTTAATKEALVHADMAHRRPAFETVLTSAGTRIKQLMGADDAYTCVIISGSGTAANETALSSIIRPTEEVLVVINGPFGERLEEILGCYGIKMHRLHSPWGTRVDLAAADRMLTDNPCISWVCTVFHETGASLINPVAELGKLAHKHGRKLFADCVSAFGGEDIHLVRDHIDVATGVGSKCVGAMPGVAFVVAKREAVPPLGPDMPRRNIYLNLQNHMRWAQEHQQTPNTPAVTLIVGFDHALRELCEETLPRRIARYKDNAKVIRDAARSMGLRMLLPDADMATTLTSIFLPPGIDVDAFIDELDERGYVVYPGKGIFHEQNMFQIANMGTINVDDCKQLMQVVQETLTAMRGAA